MRNSEILPTDFNSWSTSSKPRNELRMKPIRRFVVSDEGIRVILSNMIQTLPHTQEKLFVKKVLMIILIFRSIARPLGRLCGLKDTGSELPNFFFRFYSRIKSLVMGIRRIFLPRSNAVSNGVVYANGSVKNHVIQN